MKKNRRSLSKKETYEEIGEFWDTHDLTDYLDQTSPAEFEVDLQSEKMYFPLEVELSEKLQKTADRRGVSNETLINLWLQEKMLGDLEESA